jgi:phospholipid/cholesterol/gamma-HCH transport system ATP-binding protein
MKVISRDIDYATKVIEIEDLYKAFGTYEVLKGITLNLHKGENTVVLGRSGTGKSVLIKIVVGLLKQDSGLVRVLGEDVVSLDHAQLRDLRLKVGFCFQNGALYDSMTVGENLNFPMVRNEPGKN